MAEQERRTVSLPVESRKRDDALPTLKGYAAIFGEETDIGGMFREVIMPGAFDGAMSRPDDVRAQFNHDSNKLLGRTSAKTLRLSVDAHGLAYEIDLPDTTYARDLAASVERGDISQSSFMFEVMGQQREAAPAGSGQLPLRKITAVRLFDVAPVVFPAYEGTSVSARAAQFMADPDAAERDVDGLLPGEREWKANEAALMLETLAIDEAAG